MKAELMGEFQFLNMLRAGRGQVVRKEGPKHVPKRADRMLRSMFYFKKPGKGEYGDSHL